MPGLSARDRHRAVRFVVVAELVVALVTAVVVATAYQRLGDNLETLPAIPHLADPPSASDDGPPTPLNVLVMGSDTRAGPGNRIDGEDPADEHSDTTLLLHVSADRQTAYGISIPRDTMVQRPDCVVDGTVVPGARVDLWNEAFSVGGPLCTVQQLEHVTGVYVDHTVVVDFGGFKDTVDAVHGVEVCIPHDVDDPEHGIVLEHSWRPWSAACSRPRP